MIGTTISHYKILEKIGEGGMGVVYKAHDTRLNRLVALKFLPSHLSGNETSRQRMLNEARAASSLDHPNICNVHEIDETDSKTGLNQLYICMNYYEGESLRDRIARGPLPVEEAVGIASYIAKGLHAAHEEQIIHRDIKPGNIILTNKGEVKIVDFGLAKLAGVDLTKSVTSPGTAAYMSPEQITGKQVDKRSDIWALGVVLFEMLTGQLPYKAQNPEAMMYAVVNKSPDALDQYMKEYPEILDTILKRAMSKDPGDRYADLGELLIDLNQISQTDNSVIRRTGPRVTDLWRDYRKTAIGVIVSLILIIGIIMVRQIYFSASHAIPKLAVIPLSFAGSNEETEGFTDAIASDLMGHLTRISGLSVTSFASSIRYKGSGKTPPEIGSELGVQYLVEPTARRNGEQIQVSAKLIDVPNDKYIWAQDYEQDFRNILKIQGEITRDIAEQIHVVLTPGETDLLTPKREVDPEIYSLYIRGVSQINKLTEQGFSKGLEYLNRAVSLDPNEPQAYAALALGYALIGHTPAPPVNWNELSRQNALKALELDESQASAHLALAMQIYFDFDIEKAGREYLRALELNPSLTQARNHYGWWLVIVGREQEAIEQMKLAKALDPLNGVYPAELAWRYYFGGDFDAGINECLLSLELSPDFPQALALLGFCYAEQGRIREADSLVARAAERSPIWNYAKAVVYARTGRNAKAMAIAKAMEKNPGFFDSWCIASIYANLKMDVKALQWLNIGYENKHPYLLAVPRMKPWFISLQKDQRYIDLVKKMGLNI